MQLGLLVITMTCRIRQPVGKLLLRVRLLVVDVVIIVPGRHFSTITMIAFDRCCGRIRHPPRLSQCLRTPLLQTVRLGQLVVGSFSLVRTLLPKESARVRGFEWVTRWSQ